MAAASSKDAAYVQIEDEDPLSFRSIFSYESAFAFSKGSSIGQLNEQADGPKEIGKWEAGFRMLLLALVCVILLPFSPIVLWKCVHHLPQWERVAVFRLGHFSGVKGPGYVLLLPFVDKWKKMDLRTKILLLPNIQVVTSDAGVLAFNVEVFYRIADSETNVLRVRDPEKTLESLCRTTVVNKASSSTQASLEKDRRAIGEFVRGKLNEAVRSWGYEVSEVALPEIVVHKAAVPMERNLLEPLQTVFKSIIGGGDPSLMADPLLQSVHGPLNHFMKEKVDPMWKNVMNVAASSHPDPASCPQHGAGEPEGAREQSKLKAALDEILKSLKKPPCADQHGIYCLHPKVGRKVYVILGERSWAQEGDLCPLGVEPDVTVLADDEKTLIDVVLQKVPPYEPYFSGSITVEGDTRKLISLTSLVKN